MDARLGWRFWRDWEIAVVGQNLAARPSRRIVRSDSRPASSAASTAKSAGAGIGSDEVALRRERRGPAARRGRLAIARHERAADRVPGEGGLRGEVRALRRVARGAPDPRASSPSESSERATSRRRWPVSRDSASATPGSACGQLESPRSLDEVHVLVVSSTQSTDEIARYLRAARDRPILTIGDGALVRRGRRHHPVRDRRGHRPLRDQRRGRTASRVSS